jgi:hypothetical protein
MNDLCPDPIWRIVADSKPCGWCCKDKEMCRIPVNTEVCQGQGWVPRCVSHYGRVVRDGQVLRLQRAPR